MITEEKNCRTESVLAVAHEMMSAARTAPKACGRDNLEIIVVSGEDMGLLSEKMREISISKSLEFFSRDADSVDACQAVVLIGTKARIYGLNCGLCGFGDCKAKVKTAPDTPCSFNVNDLGLAVGSAVSIAADRRIDNRIMYSAGVAAKELQMIKGTYMAFAIPLSVSGKNVFFDRQSNCVNR